jgi:hypothetical protein
VVILALLSRSQLSESLILKYVRETFLRREIKILILTIQCSVISVTSFYNVADPRSSTFLTSVADPGCLSRILDPDFYPSRVIE